MLQGRAGTMLRAPGPRSQSGAVIEPAITRVRVNKRGGVSGAANNCHRSRFQDAGLFPPCYLESSIYSITKDYLSPSLLSLSV